MYLKFSLFICLFLASFLVQARVIGEVSTTFRAFSANDKIIIESFNDPDIPEISCYLSRAKTGGISGAIGVAEDRSEASIQCVRNGNIKQIPKKILNGDSDGDNVFKRNTSLTFKTIQVVRFYDKDNHALVYMTYSDKLIEGSPNNSITAVPLK